MGTRMGRPFQVGDIVTWWWQRGTIHGYPESGLRVVETGVNGIMARSYYEDGTLKREILVDPKDLTLESPAPGSEGAEEFIRTHALEAMRNDVCEIKELLVTLVGLMQTRRGI